MLCFELRISSLSQSETSCSSDQNYIGNSLTDLYAGILIGDWDQTFALDITQKLSVFCLFHVVVFVSVSKLFKNENLQSYMITKIPAIIKSEF